MPNRTRNILCLALAAVVSVSLSATQCPAADGTPRRLLNIVVFLSPECGHCEPVEEPALRKLSKELGVEIRPTYLDIDKTENYLRLVGIEKATGTQSQDLPVVLVGTRMIGGIPAIEKEFRAAVQGVAATGETWPAAIDDILKNGAPAGTVTVSATKAHAAYFTLAACTHCGRSDHVMRNVKLSLPNVEVRTYLAQDRSTRILQEIMEERAGIPREARGKRPRLFLAGKCLTEQEITDGAVFKLASTAEEGEPPPWIVSDSEHSAAVERLGKWFDTLTLSTMIVAGLLDGINPCAFAVIVFFISYLAALGTGRRELLGIGISFIAAVFLTYFAIGLGLSELLGILSNLPWLGRLISFLVAAFALALAAGSFYDAYLVRTGKPREIVLQLPESIKRRINVTLTRRVGGAHRASEAEDPPTEGRRSFALLPVMIAAVTSGIIVSLLELACTGQVYLPAIRMMLFDASGRQVRAMGYLLIYNLAFIVPLLGVFLLAYAGITSDQLRAWLNRRLGLTKLAMGVFFLLLAGAIVIMEAF